MGIIGNIWNKITKKEYWISNLVIVLGILLFQSLVSDFILKYVQLNEILLTGLAILIIVFFLRLLSEEILEI